ncbi:DUF3606 domain-containing protein [Chitinophaga sp. YIM B06452]|uniref:DUF3606 domain-containing protein n=1 Tax=Chitinophaga sp. YIM B06452 TaxID=3082158 RepID=UPI0031FEFE71
MTDNLKNTGKQDDMRINVNQPRELKSWSLKLGVSQEKLRQAMEAVGPMVKDVN